MRIIFKNYSVLLFVSFSVAFFSCSNDSEYNGDKDLIGTWEWIETTGGFSGEFLSPDSTGDTQQVVFEKNGCVTFYKNDQVILSTTYTIGKETSIFTNENVPVIDIGSDYSRFVYSFPYSDQLEMKENVYDGYSHKYLKQQDI